jgi:hypothetical protein
LSIRYYFPHEFHAEAPKPIWLKDVQHLSIGRFRRYLAKHAFTGFLRAVPLVNFRLTHEGKLLTDDFLMSSLLEGDRLSLECRVHDGQVYRFKCGDISFSKYFSNGLLIGACRYSLAESLRVPYCCLKLRDGKRELNDEDEMTSVIGWFGSVREIIIEATGYRGISVSLNGKLSGFLFPNSGSLPEFIAFVQASSDPRCLFDLIAARDAGVSQSGFASTSAVTCQAGAPWSAERVSLRFSLLGLEFQTEFSMDATFGFIVAQIGLRRGVMCDRIRLDIDPPLAFGCDPSMMFRAYFGLRSPELCDLN